MGETEIDLDAIVMHFAEAVRQRVRLDRIILFGTRARGEAKAESDIDLLVVSPDFGLNVLADAVLLRDCLPPHDVDIDTVACSSTEVSELAPGGFLATILEEGRVVYPARESPAG